MPCTAAMTLTNDLNRWRLAFSDTMAAWAVASAPVLPDGWPDAFDTARVECDRLRSSGSWVTGPTSLLGVIGVRRLEEQHSRVLAWLLDPSGRHGLGIRVLETLFQRCGDGTERPDLPLARVTTEE